MATVFCLDCDREINLGYQFNLGEKIKCPSCEAKMEIIKADPPQLDWTYEGPTTIKLNWFDDSWRSSPSRKESYNRL